MACAANASFPQTVVRLVAEVTRDEKANPSSLGQRGSDRRPDRIRMFLLSSSCEPDDGFARAPRRKRQRSLYEAGLERADKLAHVALKAGVTAIYTTDTERARLTVQPLSDLLKLDPLIYQVGSPDQIWEFAAKVRRDQPGKAVLVVSHNLTVPLVIDALGGDAASCSIGTAYDEFDNLCIVTIHDPGAVEVADLHTAGQAHRACPYGQSSLPNSEEIDLATPAKWRVRRWVTLRCSLDGQMVGSARKQSIAEGGERNGNRSSLQDAG